jgi:Fe-S-cluster containining protein
MSALSGDAALRFPGETPFSYACNRCRNCCHDKLIQVNPYEAARLAHNLALSTTAFIREHLENSVYLRRRADGSCGFLGPQGCTVHQDRPLVCRLYPLGRHVGASGEVRFSHLEPHPETKGIYGRAGTVTDYLAQQDVAAFVAAADRYLAVLQELYDAWRRAPASLDTDSPQSGSDRDPAPEFLDLDRAVADYCAGRGLVEPTEIEERVGLHLEAITRWLERQPGVPKARPPQLQG